MTDDQIKHLVARFLGWRLPENFNPDAGISFKRTFNEGTPYPMKHEPVGTNLFDASQAEQMVRYMVDGMPNALCAASGIPTEHEKLSVLEEFSLAFLDGWLEDAPAEALNHWKRVRSLISRVREGKKHGP